MSVTPLVPNCLMNIDLHPAFGDKYVMRYRSYIGITMELKKKKKRREREREREKNGAATCHRRRGFAQSSRSSRQPHILLVESDVFYCHSPRGIYIFT